MRNSNFAAFIDVFTSNTYVMVIMSDPSIRKYKISYFQIFIGEGTFIADVCLMSPRIFI